jgi:hypothetical protein
MPGADTDFVIYAVQDIFHPAQADAEFVGDLFVGQFVFYQIEYVLFAFG